MSFWRLVGTGLRESANGYASNCLLGDPMWWLYKIAGQELWECWLEMPRRPEFSCPCRWVRGIVGTMSFNS